MEFTVGQALTRWLGDELVVDGVDVTGAADETVTVEVAYMRRSDLSRRPSGSSSGEATGDVAMAEITQVNGRPVIDYMARDYESLLQAMRDADPAEAAGVDAISPTRPTSATCCWSCSRTWATSSATTRTGSPTRASWARRSTRRSVIEHLRLIGYQLAHRRTRRGRLTVTVPGDGTAIVTIKRRRCVRDQEPEEQPSVRFEYTGASPLTIDFGAIAADPATRKQDVHRHPGRGGAAVHATRSSGRRDGTPNQRFPLAHPGLILRPPGPAQQAGRDVMLLRLGRRRDRSGRCRRAWRSAAADQQRLRRRDRRGRPGHRHLRRRRLWGRARQRAR